MTERQEFPPLTAATVAVLRALLQEPTREMYGLQVCAAAGPADRHGAPNPRAAGEDGVAHLRLGTG